MNDSSIQSDRRHAWAREQLGLAPAADGRAARQAFLAMLDQQNFVPDELQYAAVEILTESDPENSTPCDEFLLAEEERACNAVDEFARSLFEMPPAERQAKAAGLARDCRHCDRALARLEALHPGLSVDLEIVPQDEQALRDLVQHVASLFTLDPRARSQRRCEMLREMDGGAETWEPAARQLQKQFPQIAELDAELVEQLIAWQRHSQIAERARRRAADQRPVVMATENNPSASWWWVVVALVLVSSSVRVWDQGRKANPSRSPYRTNPIDPETSKRIEELLNRHRALPQPDGLDPNAGPPAPTNDRWRDLLPDRHDTRVPSPKPDFPGPKFAPQPRPGPKIPRPGPAPPGPGQE